MITPDSPRRALRSVLAVLVLLLTGALLAVPTASARPQSAPAAVPPATLTEVTGFGANPSNLQMYVYA